MTNTVISVEHLTKRYDLGVIGTGTLARDLNKWWARWRGQPCFITCWGFSCLKDF